MKISKNFVAFSEYMKFKRVILKKPDQEKYLVTCSSHQTPNSESTNPEFILRNLLLVYLLKTYLCYLENENRPKKYKRLVTISNSLKIKVIIFARQIRFVVSEFIVCSDEQVIASFCSKVS